MGAAALEPPLFIHGQTVSHPITNRARRRETTLVKTTASSLGQATTVTVIDS